MYFVLVGITGSRDRPGLAGGPPFEINSRGDVPSRGAPAGSAAKVKRNSGHHNMPEHLNVNLRPSPAPATPLNYPFSEIKLFHFR